jgi:uncharacterized protein (TIGR00369 family)
MGEATVENPALVYMRRMIKGEAPGAPIMLTLGMRVVQAEAGHVVMEMEAGKHLTNPTGTLHGGVLCDLADAAMGATYITTLDPGESYTTLELKINFLRPVRQGKILADAHMLQSGRTVGLVECRVTDADQKPVAHVISTCMTLRGEQAQGREVVKDESAAAGAAGRSPRSS